MHLLSERVVKAMKTMKLIIIFAAVFAGAYVFAGGLPFVRPIYFRNDPEMLFRVKALCAFAAAVLTAVLCGRVMNKREGA